MSVPSLTEFEDEQRKHTQGPRSWYDRIAPELGDERRASLDAALAAEHLTSTTISHVLKRWGFDISASQVQYRRQTQRG